MTTIGDGAFCGCNSLSDINLPQSLKKIGIWAFAGCNNLQNIYYSGSKFDWIDITVGIRNESLLNAKIHYNSKITDSPVQSNDDEQILKQFGLKTENMFRNIAVSNHPIKGPRITLHDSEFYLFEFDGKIEFDFDGLPISVCVNKDKKTRQSDSLCLFVKF